MTARTASATGSRRRTAPPAPRQWGLRQVDLVAAVVLNLALITGMWVRHGGVGSVADAGTALTAAGQLTGLFGTFASLVALLLMARSPWLDQLLGTAGLAAWHRWAGIASVTLLLAHTVLTTLGYAAGTHTGVPAQFWNFLTSYPDVLMATVGLALLVAVGITSARAARRRLRYETWYFIHLYAYLGIALGFAHQLAVGTDFVTDRAARAYWVALYVVVLATLLGFRVIAPLAATMRHRLRVSKVIQEAPGVVSVYMTGRRLDQLAVRAGQFFVWRFLTRDGWWRAHPFSLSSEPDGRRLRITVEAAGDYTSALQHLRPGVRVTAEGPYGTLTAMRRTQQKVLLVAGGIGVTPLRALLGELAGEPGDIVLIYRASDWSHVVMRRELDRLVAARAATVHYVVGRRGSSGLPTDPLGPKAFRALVPDVRERDVYVCGPDGMMTTVRTSLLQLGVPAARIHLERFAY
jgi:predicted ferric reductase